MKLTISQQEAINEIAKNAYITEHFSKVRGDIVKANRKMIDQYEAEFIDGVPAEFEYEGHTIRCKLVMRPSPKWTAKDCVVFGTVADPQ